VANALAQGTLSSQIAFPRVSYDIRGVIHVDNPIPSLLRLVMGSGQG